MGPPMVPPNMFQRNKFLGCAANLFSQELEFSLSLRKNSQRSPWKLLVPDLMLVLMMPPWKLPNSAEAFCVIRLNS